MSTNNCLQIRIPSQYHQLAVLASEWLFTWNIGGHFPNPSKWQHWPVDKFTYSPPYCISNILHYNTSNILKKTFLLDLIILPKMFHCTLFSTFQIYFIYFLHLLPWSPLFSFKICIDSPLTLFNILFISPPYIYWNATVKFFVM
jgi:hypothetical protein